MNNELFFEQAIENYLEIILSWAVRKTGSRSIGEELTQEVFSQYFMAAAKAESVEKPENLLWKVAHYCWCNYLREKTKHAKVAELDEGFKDDTDFVTEMISDEIKTFQIAKMRSEISKLSYIQRESMILHYIDGYSIAETARKLGSTESTVTWHLFDARKKVKKEIERMSTATTDYIYRPGRLSVGLSGNGGPNPGTKQINSSLIKQNLCLLCHLNPKSMDELAECTGIPKPYLEYDLDWLMKQEFMLLDGKKYVTAFPIISRRHMQDIGTLFSESRKELIDKVIDYLWAHEKEIRAIGFWGSTFPTERLMWAIITMFISFTSRNSPLLMRLKRMDIRPIRPDGGKYIIMATDKSEGQELDPNGYKGEILWGGYCGIISDSCIPESNTDMYYWLGVNSFARNEYHPDIVHAEGTKCTLLYWIYISVIEPWFSEDKLEPHGKEALAEAIADGLITKDGDNYKPIFVIFTPEQIDVLREEIYRPLMEMIEPVLAELGKKISAMHKVSFPKIHKSYINYHTYVDLWDFGIYTLMYAAQDGKLWLPDTPEQGSPLTLVIIKQ